MSKIYAILKTKTAGYKPEQELIEKTGLEIGDKIELIDASIGRSSSTVTLKDLGTFNSVFFDYEEDGKEINIYNKKEFWNFIHYVNK